MYPCSQITLNMARLLAETCCGHNKIKIIIVISIQPLGRFWQEPELNQATGMALAHCILGNSPHQHERS
jgi:hypothetical protein